MRDPLEHFRKREEEGGCDCGHVGQGQTRRPEKVAAAGSMLRGPGGPR